MVDVVTARSVQSWSCFLRFDSPGQDSYIPSTFEVGAWIRELNLGLLCVVSSTTLWVERGPACFSSSRQILNSGSSWPSLLLVQKMRASHIDKPARYRTKIKLGSIFQDTRHNIEPRKSFVVWCGGFALFNPPRPPMLWWWVLDYLTLPLPCGVVRYAVVMGWYGGGFGLINSPSSPCGVVVVGFGFFISPLSPL